jgi:DNA-binding SARP family transcriptional activator/tetratricopeptide (TPR) repeat protein
MEFRILGPVEAWDGTQRLGLGGPKPRALLAVLLLHANQVVSTDRLIDQLWGEAPPPTARNLIQVYVSRFRHALHRSRDGSDPERVLVTHPPGYLLRVEPGQLDADRFEELTALARQATADHDLEGAAACWRAALALWRGPALDGIDSETLRRTAVPRLEEARLVALEERLEVDLRLGRHAELVGELEALVAAHQDRERLRRQLMLALYRSARQAEALAVYRGMRQVLVEELGLEPSPALQELERAILRADPALELAFPAGGGAAPQLALPPGPCQLPPDIDDFTGREAAVAQVQQLLEGSPATAIVISVIAGKAGVGKTALAVHLAHRLRPRFADGQLYVNLRGAEAQPLDPAEVLAQFLRALGVEGAVIAEGPEERVRQYRARLADRRVLVVLDNAANEAQVRPLLPGSRGCAALVTSRASLSGLEAAHPLRLDVLTSDQAVALLAKLAGPERVTAEPTMARTIVELCGRLPLAVRIAGAKLAAKPHWRLARLADHLGNERRRLDVLKAGDLEVRASVALSYQGRREDEQWLFRLLGLLEAPDFAAWMAAALMDAPLAVAEDLLERLVDAQLVEAAGEDQVGRPRYRLHDLLRVFAQELLPAEPVDTRRAALERTLGAQLALAERAHAALAPGDAQEVARGVAPRWIADAWDVGRAVEAEPLGWFDAERASLVAGVRQAAKAELAEVAWELACALTSYLETRGYWQDWWSTHELVLAATRRAGNRRGQAQVLRSLGESYLHRGDLHRARASFQDCLTLFEDLGDRHGQAYARLGLGFVAVYRGYHAEAVTCFDHCLALFEDLGDQHGEAVTLDGLAELRRAQGRLDEATACLDRSMAAFRDLADRHSQAATLRRRGDVLCAQGRLDEATACLDRSMAAFRDLGDRRWEAIALHSLAEVHRAHGHLDDAIGCLDRSMAAFRDLGDRRWEAIALHSLAEVHRAHGHLDDAIACLDTSIPIFRALGLRPREASALDSLGHVLAARGDRVAAQHTWHAAQAIFLELGMPEATEMAGRLNRGRP